MTALHPYERNYIIDLFVRPGSPLRESIAAAPDIKTAVHLARDGVGTAGYATRFWHAQSGPGPGITVHETPSLGLLVRDPPKLRPRISWEAVVRQIRDPQPGGRAAAAPAAAAARPRRPPAAVPSPRARRAGLRMEPRTPA